MPATLDGATAWIAEHRRRLCDQAALHGAILFRGFPLTGPEDFDHFITAFDLPNFPYEASLSNAVRAIRTPRVFTANEAPSTVRILALGPNCREQLICQTPAPWLPELVWDAPSASRTRRLRRLPVRAASHSPHGTGESLDVRSSLTRTRSGAGLTPRLNPAGPRSMSPLDERGHDHPGARARAAWDESGAVWVAVTDPAGAEAAGGIKPSTEMRRAIDDALLETAGLRAPDRASSR